MSTLPPLPATRPIAPVRFTCPADPNGSHAPGVRIVRPRGGSPAFSDVVAALVSLVSSGEIFPHTAASFLRAGAGFFIAVIFGTALGLLMARVRAGQRAVEPILLLIYPVPKPALIPLFMVWLGIGDVSKISHGAPGVETRMVLLYDGGVVQKRITLNRWIEVTSTTPAKIMGMFPKKGTIAVGSDADIVVWDPGTTSTISAKTHHMRVDYNPYEGRRVKGKAVVVLSRGEVIVEKGTFLGKKGRGKFIKRGSPLLQT